MKKAVSASAIALISLFVAPAAALAAPSAPAPKFSSDLIVPNASLGGLALGGSVASAKKIFGAKDCNSGGCTYTGTGGGSANLVFAITKAHKPPFIGQISISGLGSPRALSQLKTAKGIGLGSTAAQVKKAYPRATGSAKQGDFQIPGSGEHVTTFGLSQGRVNSISMASIQVG